MTPQEVAAELRDLAKSIERLGKVPARLESAGGVVVLLGRTKNAKRCSDYRKRRRERVTTFDRHVSESMSRHASEHGHDTCQATDPSPFPGPLSPSALSSGSVSPENSSLISSSGKPESKRARRTKPTKPPGWRTVPSDWEPNDKHRAIARDRGLDFALELDNFRDYEFPRDRRNADAAFRIWLRSSKCSPKAPHNASSRDGVPIVQHPVFKPEPRIPAADRPSLKEIDGMLSKVGRVAT